jgi:hypothetical protein
MAHVLDLARAQIAAHRAGKRVELPKTSPSSPTTPATTWQGSPGHSCRASHPKRAAPGHGSAATRWGVDGRPRPTRRHRPAGAPSRASRRSRSVGPARRSDRRQHAHQPRTQRRPSRANACRAHPASPSAHAEPSAVRRHSILSTRCAISMPVQLTAGLAVLQAVRGCPYDASATTCREVRGDSSRCFRSADSRDPAHQVLLGGRWGFKSVSKLSTCPEQGKHRVDVSEGGL